MSAKDDEVIVDAVREHYGAAARAAMAAKPSSCCGDSAASADGDTCCGSGEAVTLVSDLYSIDELEGVPLKAALASLGCGNPTALAELKPGEVVLDLGSGGGIDVLLSARRVGPGGFAYGLDMTDDMLQLARRNAADAGARNVEFLKGDIGDVPLPDGSVDVIISNCVINLAVDKDRVFREAFRVLKPGGRFAVSDIVIHGGLPAGLDAAALRSDLSSWAGCVAGALTDEEYRSGLAAAGFAEIDLEVTRRFAPEDLEDVQVPGIVDNRELTADVVSRFASTFVRARKPA